MKTQSEEVKVLFARIINGASFPLAYNYTAEEMITALDVIINNANSAKRLLKEMNNDLPE